MKLSCRLILPFKSSRLIVAPINILSYRGYRLRLLKIYRYLSLNFHGLAIHDGRLVLTLAGILQRSRLQRRGTAHHRDALDPAVSPYQGLQTDDALNARPFGIHRRSDSRLRD